MSTDEQEFYRRIGYDVNDYKLSFYNEILAIGVHRIWEMNPDRVLVLFSPDGTNSYLISPSENPPASAPIFLPANGQDVRFTAAADYVLPAREWYVYVSVADTVVRSLAILRAR